MDDSLFKEAERLYRENEELIKRLAKDPAQEIARNMMDSPSFKIAQYFADQHKELIKHLSNDPALKLTQDMINKDFVKEALRMAESAAQQTNSVFESMTNINLNKPEIRFPIRNDDCVAAPICESIGNLRKACSGGSLNLGMHGPGIDVCISSLILLVSRLAGMWPKEMLDNVEEKRKIGFIDTEERADCQE